MACANEQLGLFLESHDAAFDTSAVRHVSCWTTDLTRSVGPYRALTKGKVESGAKYVKSDNRVVDIFAGSQDGAFLVKLVFMPLMRRVRNNPTPDFQSFFFCGFPQAPFGRRYAPLAQRTL